MYVTIQMNTSPVTSENLSDGYAVRKINGALTAPTKQIGAWDISFLAQTPSPC